MHALAMMGTRFSGTRGRMLAFVAYKSSDQELSYLALQKLWWKSPLYEIRSELQTYTWCSLTHFIFTVLGFSPPQSVCSLFED